MERIPKYFLIVVAVAALLAGQAEAQYIPGTAPGGTLPNYMFPQYVTPQGPSQTTAGMYPAPHHVPWHVGASSYTYQPLQPHEMMWQHRRNYYNYYAGPEAFYADQCGARAYPGGGGLNKTQVVWQSGANHMGNLPSSIVPLAGLQYRWAQRYWCIGGNCGGYSGGCATGTCSSGTCPTGDCGTGYAVGQQPGYGAPATLQR